MLEDKSFEQYLALDARAIILLDLQLPALAETANITSGA